MSDSISNKFFEQYNDLVNSHIDTLKVRYASENTMYGKIPAEIIDYYFELSTLGKKTRGALAYLMLRNSKSIDSETAVCASIALEFFHTAILVHDDVIDNSELRRNLPTINIKYGVNQAICIGDYGFYLTYQILHNCAIELNRLWQATKAFNAYAIRLILGQLAEIDAKSKNNVSLNRIFELYYMKSGQYTFEMPLMFGYILGGVEDTELKEALRKYAYYAGVIFQIIDDYQDIYGELTSLGKPVGGDLREGKHTLFTYYLKSSDNETHRNFINEYLGKNTSDITIQNQYRTYLCECNAKDKAKDVVNTFSHKAQLSIESCKSLGKSEEAEVLKELIMTLKNKIA